MNFEIISQFLKLLESNNSNFLSTLLGGLFSGEKQEPQKQINQIDPNDRMWQLPHFDFVEKPKQNFVNQEVFEQTKQNFNNTKEDSPAPNFDFEMIFNLLNSLKGLFQKQEQKPEKPSFVKSLKRCD